MLYEVHPTTGGLKKIQVDSHPRCALFEQQLVCGTEDGAPGRIIVRFRGSPTPGSETDEASKTIEIPLTPDWSSLEKIDVVLHGSPATAYRMGDPYDSWFGRHFGVRTILVYLGDGRRAVLGKTLPPKSSREPQQRGWVSSLTSYITGSQSLGKGSDPGLWITFTDVAPLLVTSEMSLRDVRDRLLGGLPLEMFKFRPNIVVDGEGESAWAEDFWAELSIRDVGRGDERRILQLTGNCARCVSLNVDYNTGKPAEGELGNVLKKLMKERRVDKGAKWSPIFGRYAFLDSRHTGDVIVSVGDDVEVTRRNTERSVWDWPGL